MQWEKVLFGLIFRRVNFFWRGLLRKTVRMTPVNRLCCFGLDRYKPEYCGIDWQKNSITEGELYELHYKAILEFWCETL